MIYAYVFLSKKLIYNFAVLHLCSKPLKKIPLKEFNVSIKVSSVEPATILTMNSFLPYFSSFLSTTTEGLFSKILFHGCFWKDLHLKPLKLIFNINI